MSYSEEKIKIVLYMNLLIKKKNVNQGTIVFEAFGGKNYSDSPKYIYEYMQNTIQITIMFGHLKT